MTRKPTPKAKLTVTIPAKLKTRLTRTIEAANLAAINLSSVITQALENHLPRVEALAAAAQEQRTMQQGRTLLRKLENHISKTTNAADAAQGTV